MCTRFLTLICGWEFKVSQNLQSRSFPRSITHQTREGLEEQCCHLGTFHQLSNSVFSNMGHADPFHRVVAVSLPAVGMLGRMQVLIMVFLAWLLVSCKIISPCGSATCACQNSCPTATSCLTNRHPALRRGLQGCIPPQTHFHTCYLQIPFFMFGCRSFSTDKN